MKKLFALLFIAAPAFAAPNGDVIIKGVKQGFAPNDPAGAVEYHTGLIHKPGLKAAKTVDLSADPACDNLPDHFDLLTDVTPSPVSPVRNQGQCGSCWSFSESGGFESWLRTMGKGYSDLAEQELVSNDRDNYGCNGGNLSPYQHVHGQGLEADFPYTARDSSPRQITPVGQAPEWEVIGGSGAAKVRSAQCGLFKYHTVPWITVGADNDWGSPPSQDGAVWSRCSNNGTNHAIGMTGWKTVNGQVYFHAKNSWGSSWGQNGYAYIPLGCDGFGEEIAFLPAQPTPPPPTCDGKPVGTIETLACPAGQIGEHSRECSAAGKWGDKVNTCKDPVPPPAPFSLPTWLIYALGGIAVLVVGFFLGKKVK
jgi:hypothetical protein